MAQIIGSIIPLHLDPFDMKRVGFQCRASVVNPIHMTASIQTVHSTATTDKTKTHLSNLEKLLQTGAKEVIQQQQPRPIGPGSKMAHRPETTRMRRVLDGLNLARIWAEAMPIQASSSANGGEVAAEMSPRRLIRLQQLLSKQPEYSPRNHLGTRWIEYHGSRDWAGLLDPLDENLRREVVRYGEFIQAAYQSFHSDPATTQAGITSWREVRLPDKSYKVTKSLYATSSVGFPKWIDDVAPDLSWMTQRSSWVGYVAVCEDEREISRMGRRDIVIALRGTATCLEWVENARAGLVSVENNPNSNPNQTSETESKVECGFLSLFQTKGEHVASLSETVVQEIRRLLDMYKGETLSITITGHSLGAALALLVADEISTCAPEVPPVAVFSFGGPKVGNRAFADRVKSNNVKVLRIVNNQDLITKVPGMFIGDQLDQKLRSNNQVASILDMLDDMPWSYSHVGTELRVDTKMSPYLKPDADVACCHDLEAYLHLVDGFLASNCPFRPNAKRSLLKLLSEQGSNVKKLYTSKTKSLTLKIESDGVVSTMSNCMPSPKLQHE